MLVLSRRQYESIRIGDDIIVTFQGYRNGKASLGIDAPKDVPVLREELYQQKREDSDGDKG